MTQPSPTSLPSENFQRGVIFALIALPAGVIAWDLLWSLGFVASIVSFGIAYLAERLYRFGSGGRLGRNGAIAVAAITIGTLIIAVISGFAVQIVGLYSSQSGMSIAESLLSPRFWSIVFASMTSGQAVVSLLLAAAFAALGCFRILSTAFRQTRVQPTMDAAAATADPTVPAPPAPQQGLILNGEPIPPAPDEPRDTQ